MLDDYFDQLKCAAWTPSSLFDAEAVLKHSKLFAFHPAVQEPHGYVLNEKTLATIIFDYGRAIGWKRFSFRTMH